MILLGVKFDRSWKIGFHKMTPRCPPWCQSQFLLGVYFLSLFPFRLKTKWKKNYSHRSTLKPFVSQPQFSSGPNFIFSFWVFFFLFRHDSIYLNLMFVCFFVVSLRSCPFSWFVIIRAAVENCHWWCVCGFFASLPLSSSLIWHVGTSCQMSRGGRSPNVNVWKVTGTIFFVGDLKPPEDITLDLCTLLKFCGELR